MYVGYSTALVFEDAFTQSASAVVSCAVSGLSELNSPVASIWQTSVRPSRRTPAASGVTRGLSQGGQSLAEGGPLATVEGSLANAQKKS